MRLGDDKVVLPNMKVTANQYYPTEDLSGDSSSTATAEKGIKAVTLVCTGVVNLNDKSSVQGLRDLIALARAVDESNNRIVYPIAYGLAELMGVKEVRFDDNFNVAEDKTLEAYKVTFSLLEHKSVPELNAERISAPDAVQQITPNASLVAASGETGSGTSAKRTLSSTEQALKRIDDWLGGSDEVN